LLLKDEPISLSAHNTNTLEPLLDANSYTLSLTVMLASEIASNVLQQSRRLQSIAVDGASFDFWIVGHERAVK